MLGTLRRPPAPPPHLGLDDGDEAVLLADDGVLRERVDVLLDREVRGRTGLGDLDHAAPLGEARAGRVVLGAARAQAVEARRHGLAVSPGDCGIKRVQGILVSPGDCREAPAQRGTYWQPCPCPP